MPIFGIPMNDIDKLLAELKAYRLKQDWSQTKIADELNIGRSKYQAWEDGRSKPKYDDTVKIKSFLAKVSPNGQKELTLIEQLKLENKMLKDKVKLLEKLLQMYEKK